MYNYFKSLIKRVEPNHNAEDVLTNIPISVYFTEPIDCDSVNDSNFWVNPAGIIERVPGVLSYEAHGNDYILSFAPSSLSQDTTYCVTLRGESEAIEGIDEIDEGIKTVLGNGLAGNYTWSFTTGHSILLDKANLLYPDDRCVINETPTFRWSPVLNSVIYRFVISRSPSFEDILFDEEVNSTEYTPNFYLDNYMEYWWKVCAVDTNNMQGEWSSVYSFYKGNTDFGAVTPEDVSLQVYPIPEKPKVGTYKILNVIPEDGVENVPLNYGYVAVEVDGYVDPRDINNKTFKLIGEKFFINSDIVPTNQWWNKTTIKSPVNYGNKKCISDYVRAIDSHGDVPLNRMTIYNPELNKTIIIGVIDVPQLGYTEIDEQPVRVNTVTVRNKLVGRLDGYNKNFLLPQMPVSHSVQIYKDGELVNNYNIVSQAIIFNVAPASVSIMEAQYDTGYTIREKLNGAVNDINTEYTISKLPLDGTFRVFKNDAWMYEDEYTRSLININLVTPLVDTDFCFAEYQTDVEYIINEIPEGTIDGINTEFTLSDIPYKDTEQVYLNGLFQRRDVDYTILDNVITFIVAPVTGSSIYAEYYTENPIVAGETPLGNIDGINNVFTLSNIPASGTVEVFLSGRLVSQDTYTVRGNEIVTDFIPPAGSWIKVNYRANDSFEIPFQEPTHLNKLKPNNKYTIYLNNNNLIQTKKFTSQYWPVFVEPDEVRVELLGIVNLSDSELYHLIRKTSIEAIHIQTSPLHYLVKNINEVVEIPFDPNDPVYCVYQYVKYRTAYDILMREATKAGLNGATKKSLGDLAIEKSAPGQTLMSAIKDLKDKLQPWDDCIHGHTKRGQLSVAPAVKGRNNAYQYQSDYPMKNRMYNSDWSSKREYFSW